MRGINKATNRKTTLDASGAINQASYHHGNNAHSRYNANAFTSLLAPRGASAPNK